MHTLSSKQANVAMRLIVNALLQQQGSKIIITQVSHEDASDQSAKLTFQISGQADKSTALGNQGGETFRAFMWFLLSDTQTEQSKKAIAVYFRLVFETIGVSITGTDKQLFANIEAILPLVNFKVALQIAIDAYKAQRQPANLAASPLEKAIEQSPSVADLKAILATAFQAPPPPPIKKSSFWCCCGPSLNKVGAVVVALPLSEDTQQRFIGILMHTFKDFDTKIFELLLNIEESQDYLNHPNPQALINQLLAATKPNAVEAVEAEVILTPHNGVSTANSSLSTPLLNTVARSHSDESHRIAMPYGCTLPDILPFKTKNSADIQ